MTLNRYFMIIEEDYLRLKELAKKLNITPAAILRDKNKIMGFPSPKRIKFKNKIFFNKKEIDEFIKYKDSYVHTCVLSFTPKEKRLGFNDLKTYKFGSFKYFLKKDVMKVRERAEDFYTVREAAKYLNISEHKVANGIIAGHIYGYPCPKHLKINNLILFKKTDVHAYHRARSELLSLTEIAELFDLTHHDLIRLKNQIPNLLPEPAIKRTKFTLYPKKEVMKLISDSV